MDPEEEEEEEVYVIPVPEGDEAFACAIVPLEEGLAMLDAQEDDEEEETTP